MTSTVRNAEQHGQHEKDFPEHSIPNYRMRIVSELAEIDSRQWDALAHAQPGYTPFLSHAFLHAMHASRSACAETGWQPQFLTLWSSDPAGADRLEAALPLYLKSHSYGEYVFDWAWADAYDRAFQAHGQRYYPKLLSAMPFTPVQGARLLARNGHSRQHLLQATLTWAEKNRLSSFHVLFPTPEEAQLLQASGLLLRQGVQFHWQNPGYQNFEHFLSTLEQKKRKNIRAERRKVREAGVCFRQIQGKDIAAEDWTFFLRCYHRTYAEHHSSPYLNLDFFTRIGANMPQHLLLIVAERAGQPIASSLLVYQHDNTVASPNGALYGRYWGAIEHVPCLHFETAYYQPLEFCIAQGIAVFEGGAQGEHKLARGFLPVATTSAHWLAHTAFADAVELFLKRERQGIAQYVDELQEHSPFRQELEQAMEPENAQETEQKREDDKG